MGIPASLTENLDAMEAVKHIPIEDRDTFKYALAATLVKNQAHWKAFETVFEVYFSLRGAQYEITEDDLADLDDADGEIAAEGDRGGSGDMLSPEELAEMLYRALMRGDAEMIRAAARQAVRRYAGMEPGRPVGGTYYLYRTLRNLDLEGVLERLMDVDQQTEGGVDDFELRLRRDTYELRIAELKRQIEAEIRRRLVADRGVEAMAKTLRKPLPSDIDFMHASREEMASLRKAIYPLTRKLAARLVRKRRHGRSGPLDFRSTVRHSLSYGGVPVEPKFRHPRPHKPDIMVVADVSGSVAAFARFTLHLVYAISSQFSKVRSFVFIDGLDEVTQYFEGTDDIAEAVHRVNTEADVVWVDGHSDYGHALGVFWDHYGNDVGPRSDRADPRRRPQQLPRPRELDRQSPPGEGPPRVLAQPGAPQLLGHRRLDRGGVRPPLRRRVRGPQPAPARSLRGPPGLALAHSRPRTIGVRLLFRVAMSAASSSRRDQRRFFHVCTESVRSADYSPPTESPPAPCS